MGRRLFTLIYGRHAVACLRFTVYFPCGREMTDTGIFFIIQKAQIKKGKAFIPYSSSIPRTRSEG
jgi:hypothetical protein